MVRRPVDEACIESRALPRTALDRCRSALALAVAVLLTVGTGAVLAGDRPASPPAGQIAAPVLALDRAGGIPGPSFALGTIPPNTDFTLVFSPTVDAETRTVITAAAGIWSAALATTVPIVLEVDMQAMQTGLLGAAGPTSAFYGLDSFPSADTLYPVAQANQFAGTDLDPADGDIAMVLSSSLSWDKSVDGVINGQSMLSVVLHELGHGLGLTSWARQTATGYSVSYEADGVTLVLAYDRLVATSDGSLLGSLVSNLLGAAIATPMHWTGPAGNTAFGRPIPLYSPAPFMLGSSIGHLDEATFTSELMTPYLGQNEPHTVISPVTLAMLRDTGWQTSSPSLPAPSGSTTTAQPAELAGAFVDAVATDFLGREASTTELNTWIAHLMAGGARSDVTHAFASSSEWIGVLVDSLYRSTLGRAGDAGGKAFWVRTIQAGATPAEVASQFYASDEYFRRSGGTTTAWVSDLYAEILGRQADAGGLGFWVQQASFRDRASIAFDFYQSLESRRDRVENLFDQLLARTPDASGWAYWADVLRNGRDVELATFLAASDEYLIRAIGRFT